MQLCRVVGSTVATGNAARGLDSTRDVPTDATIVAIVDSGFSAAPRNR